MRSPTGRQSAVRPVLAWLAVLTVAACTFDYSDADIEGGEESLPQLEIFDARMVMERDNRLELEVARVASYPDRRRQEFESISFREYGPDGDLRLEGFAERGILYTDVENVELRGTVRFYSQLEEAELESRYLFWDNAERVLVGEPDDEVTIEREDGTMVRGRGLRVDGRRNSVEFSGQVRGRYTGDQEERE